MMYRKLSGRRRIRLALEVVTADSKQALKEFIELPYSLYRDDPIGCLRCGSRSRNCWTGPSIRFTPTPRPSFFWRGRTAAWWAAIAAIVDRNHNRFHEENAGFFGFFECVERPGSGGGSARRAPDSGCSTAAPVFSAAR